MTELPYSIDDKEVILIDDVIRTRRTIKAALEAQYSCGRAKSCDGRQQTRDHREVPIQPDLYGRVVPTCKDETIDLRLREVDGEEGIFLCKNYE